ncbi:hypothetical protein B0H12DRAFT_1138160 [Mycena haematopus]|nr:hypothetical protein B0H12DRAFT_1160548 [Mycena haematopus]KAJ7237904.1 hypothetical protein B0H12DRAFT_1138160 [Mycena haematopus]
MAAPLPPATVRSWRAATHCSLCYVAPQARPARTRTRALRIAHPHPMTPHMREAWGKPRDGCMGAHGAARAVWLSAHGKEGPVLGDVPIFEARLASLGALAFGTDGEGLVPGRLTSSAWECGHHPHWPWRVCPAFHTPLSHLDLQLAFISKLTRRT